MSDCGHGITLVTVVESCAECKAEVARRLDEAPYLRAQVQRLTEDLAASKFAEREWHVKALDLTEAADKQFTETTSIHNDMLALARLVGVPYDGLSSPAGFLHGDIMPAIERLTEERDAALASDQHSEWKRAEMWREKANVLTERVREVHGTAQAMADMDSWIATECGMVLDEATGNYYVPSARAARTPQEPST